MGVVLVYVSKKYRPYFLANKIMVLTDQPFKKAIKSNDKTIRMVKFSRVLDDFLIDYVPRIIQKGQAIANFLVE